MEFEEKNVVIAPPTRWPVAGVPHAGEACHKEKYVLLNDV